MARRSAAWHGAASLLTLITVAVLSPAPRVAAAPAAKGEPPHFSTEQDAEQHCPSDLVVWLDTAHHIFHYRGQRWYGSTEGGAYACRKEAQTHGYRPNRTGK